MPSTSWTLIDAQYAVCAGAHDHVGDELGPDGDAGLILTVLPRIAVVRQYAGDARGGGAARRVHEEQQFEQVLRRRVRGLHDEHIGAADVLVEPDEDFAVGEARHRRLGDLDAERLGDLIGERPIGRAGEHTITVDGNCESVHRERA